MIIKKYLLALILSLSGNFLFAQWQTIHQSSYPPYTPFHFINKVHFINSSDGIGSSEGHQIINQQIDTNYHGSILKTTNSGNTWNPIFLSPRFEMLDVFIQIQYYILCSWKQFIDKYGYHN